MIKLRFYCLATFFILVSCSGKPCQHMTRINELEAELETLRKSEINTTKTNLFHIVYFDLKENLTQKEMEDFTASIEELNKIKTIKAIKSGGYEDVGDPRAIDQYEYAMILEFETQQDFLSYQQDSIHLRIIADTKAFMAGPPATYDFTP